MSNALLFDEAESRKQQLEQAQSHFLTSLADDLNEPLHQLSNMASRLGETGPLNREQARLSRHILRASDQMVQLLSGLIELALGNGRSALNQQPCDLLTIVTDVVQDLQPEAAAKNVAVQLTAEADQYQVMGSGPAAPRRKLPGRKRHQTITSGRKSAGYPARQTCPCAASGT